MSTFTFYTLMTLVIAIGSGIVIAIPMGFNTVLDGIEGLIKRKDWAKIIRLTLYFLIPAFLFTACVNSCLGGPSMSSTSTDNPYQGSLEQATDLGTIDNHR